MTEPKSLEVFLRDPRAFWLVDRGRREGVLWEGPPRTFQAQPQDFSAQPCITGLPEMQVEWSWELSPLCKHSWQELGYSSLSLYQLSQFLAHGWCSRCVC